MFSPVTLVLLVLALGAVILIIDFRRWRRARDAAQRSQVAQVGGETPPRPAATENLSVYLLTEEKAQFACGHEFAVKFGHDFYGERMEVSDAYAAKREKCGDCMMAEIKPLIIRCCACGHVIMPGEPVAAYGDNGSFKKEWSTTLPDGKTVLGCMSWDCCPSGGFFAGHWSTKGFRPAFGEHSSLMAQVIATGKPVSVTVGDGEVNVTVLDDDRGKPEGDKEGS